jgi:hypothetical protein
LDVLKDSAVSASLSDTTLMKMKMRMTKMGNDGTLGFAP